MNPIVLIFRAKTGCRQYAFETLDEVRAWCARRPYRDEHGKAVRIRLGEVSTDEDRFPLGAKGLRSDPLGPLSDVPAWLEEAERRYAERGSR